MKIKSSTSVFLTSGILILSFSTFAIGLKYASSQVMAISEKLTKEKYLSLQKGIDTPKKYAEMLNSEKEDSNKDIEYLLQRYGRMEEHQKGILLNPDVPPPPCSDSLRGLIWFVKSNDISESDVLIICLRGSSDSSGWYSII